MADFDWVTARSECSLATVFHKLKEQVKTDVEKAQALRSESHKMFYGFRFVAEGKACGAVLEGNKVFKTVSFRLTDNAIEVYDETGAVKSKATPTISDDGECRLKVNGEEKELWQFRKQALEELLFHFF